MFPGVRFYNPDFATRAVIRPLLDRMLVLSGYLPFHAAAVYGGTGCIIVGNAGSGKSTLLAGLVRSGMGFLGDDRALVKKTDGRFEIRAFPEFIRMPPDDFRPKRAYCPPDSSTLAADIGVVVFLEPDIGRVRLERIGKAETAARLLAAVSPFMGAECWSEMGDSVAGLAATVESWMLKGWGGSGERLSLVRDMMAGRTQG
jgi:hypothetical protein